MTIPQNEQSMDEILASIRKIITDEEDTDQSQEKIAPITQDNTAKKVDDPAHAAKKEDTTNSVASAPSSDQDDKKNGPSIAPPETKVNEQPTISFGKSGEINIEENLSAKATELENRARELKKRMQENPEHYKQDEGKADKNGDDFSVETILSSTPIAKDENTSSNIDETSDSQDPKTKETGDKKIDAWSDTLTPDADITKAVPLILSKAQIVIEDKESSDNKNNKVELTEELKVIDVSSEKEQVMKQSNSAQIDAPVMDSIQLEPAPIIEAATKSVTSSNAFSVLKESLKTYKKPEQKPTKEPFTMDNSNKSLYDIVSDSVKPMINEWLEGNLPAMVEKMVQKEIQKMRQDAEE